MEYSDLGKLLGIVISVLGTIAATSFNISQSRKLRVDLLGALDEAIKSQSRHATCEIFRLLYGLRMNYKDIIALLNDDNCAKIIYALKKTPGLVTYSNGDFQYSEVSANKWVNMVKKFSSKAFTYVLSFCVIVLSFVANFTQGATSLTAFFVLIGFAILLTVQLKQNSYDRMIKNLVNKT